MAFLRGLSPLIVPETDAAATHQSSDTSFPKPAPSPVNPCWYTRVRSRTFLHPSEPCAMNPLLSSPVAGLAILTLLLIAAAVPAQTYPDVSQLPSRPEFPDPQVMLNGDRVTTKDQWFGKRRPELQGLFQHYMYGVLPPPLKVEAKVERTDPKAFKGKATLKEITVFFGPPKTPPINLLLVVPNNRQGPAPVFVGMNFCGNHAVVTDPKVRIPTAWMYPN